MNSQKGDTTTVSANKASDIPTPCDENDVSRRLNENISKDLFRRFVLPCKDEHRMLELDEEQELIRKSLQGDHAAFEALIMCHQRMVHSLTYRMTGSLADADDLAQETFIQAFRQIASYRGDAKYSSWLYRVAMNLCLNWKTRQARQQTVLQTFAEQRAIESSVSADRAQSVRAALLKLHPKQRAAVVLTVYDGLRHAEAAEVLGCSETTVSWRVFAARRKLKKLLANIATGEVSHE